MKYLQQFQEKEFCYSQLDAPAKPAEPKNNLDIPIEGNRQNRQNHPQSTLADVGISEAANEAALLAAYSCGRTANGYLLEIDAGAAYRAHQDENQEEAA